MYDFIKGTLIELNTESAVVETANGIGYRIFIPLSFFFSEPKLNAPLYLYLSAIYREDSQRLFGFPLKEERALFEKLCSISGIGPKTAMSLIGHLSEKELKEAILTSNLKLIEKVPGIGKKTAERLVMELRGSFDSSPKKKGAFVAVYEESSTRGDGINALINLGYSSERAIHAIEKAITSKGASSSLEEVIKTALQVMQK